MGSSRNNDLVREAIAGSTTTALGWAYAKCPLCGSRRSSLSVNAESGWWQCFKCKESGKLKGDVEYGRRLEAPPPPKPTDWHLLADPDVRSSIFAQDAIAYLAMRRVDPATVEAAQLGIGINGKLAGRIVLPIHDDAGELVGVVARRYTPGPDPYYNTPGLNRVCMPGRECLRNESTIPVYGVEGPYDFLPYYGWAYSYLGKPTDAQLTWIATHAKRPVVQALDGDAHREGLRAAARLKIRGVQSWYHRLPATTDPGSILLPPPWTLTGQT